MAKVLSESAVPFCLKLAVRALDEAASRLPCIGEEVMRTTKQKRRYTITLPPEAMAVLRWHVDTQLTTPEQQDSDLLFPAVNGKFRSPSVLNKPLDEVGLELGLNKTTPSEPSGGRSTTSLGRRR